MDGRVILRGDDIHYLFQRERRRPGEMIPLGAMRKGREWRQANTLFERREIALEQRHVGINAIRHPSGECRAVASNRLNTQ